MRTLLKLALACLLLSTHLAHADNQKPSQIRGVEAQRVSDSSIRVSWNRGQDNVGIDGYNVYRNGSYITTVFTTEYTDNGVSASRSYRYAVAAFDQARNYSIMSDTVRIAGDDEGNTAGTGADSRPQAPTNLLASVLGDSSARISWNPPRGGADGYNIYLDGGYLTTVRGSTRVTISSLNKGQSYRVQVVAFRNGQFSSLSSAVRVNTAGGGTSTVDSPPPPPSRNDGRPGVPNGLRAAVQDGSTIKLTWDSPAGAVEGHNIYINDQYTATVKGVNSYTASGLRGDSSYSFYLHAFRDGKFSERSSTVFANTGAAGAAPPPPRRYSGNNSAIPDGFELVFSDDFNRMSIDSTKWNTAYMWGPDLIINNEEQYYVDVLNKPDFGVSPFKHTGDKLIIEATRTPDWLMNRARNQKYLSGAMTTYRKFSLLYGYVEMRAKLPRGKGLWPALWLLHQPNSPTGRRPEIDIMEQLGAETRTIYQTYHWEENGVPFKTESFRAGGPDFTSDFHIFGMLWEPGRVTWFIDGVKTAVFDSDKVSDESMYLLMNLAVGGTWGGSPDSSTPLPAQYEIDYVRVYQRR